MDDDKVTLGELYRNQKKMQETLDKLETRMWVALAGGFSAVGILLVQTFSDATTKETLTSIVRWIA